jgi:hypothetical protein
MTAPLLSRWATGLGGAITGSDQAPRCGRADARHRQKLQRLAQHDFETDRVRLAKNGRISVLEHQRCCSIR